MDYTLEWGVPIVNQGLETVWIEDGERICQVVFNKYEQVSWEEVENIEETERKGGFGHSGSK